MKTKIVRSSELGDDWTAEHHMAAAVAEEATHTAPQTKARRRAQLLTEQTGEVYVATTEDVHRGQFDRTFRWGVVGPDGVFHSID